MKNLLTGVLLVICFSGNTILAQNIKKPIQPSVESVVKQNLKQLFGDYFDTYGSTPERVQYYVNIYSRITYILENEAPKNIKNLSDLVVKSKYNPTVIHHDNITNFDANKFNPFKYFIDFQSNKDQYFKIYGTSVVMKISKFLK